MANLDKNNTKPHHGRNDLIGEHRWGDAGQLIFLVIFLLVWITDSFFLNLTTFPNEYISIYIRLILGVAFFIPGFFLARQGMKIVFGKERPKAIVIREGVFNRMRHPIYLGAILFYFFMLSLSISIMAAVVLLMVIGFYHFIARYEEKLLLQEFGVEYEQYMNEVPMWFPKLCRKK